MKSKSYFKLLLFIILFIFNIISVKAYTNVSGTIGTGTTWTSSGSPYVVIGNLTIAEGVTLNIEPGVVVKVKPVVKITSYGTLNAVGTLENNIYFTAYDDTSVDSTVGDGSVSMPTQFGNGDYWRYLIVSGEGSNNSILKHVQIKYYGNTTPVQYHYRRYDYYYRPNELYRSGLQLINTNATVDSNYISYPVNRTYHIGSTRKRDRRYNEREETNLSGIFILGGSPYVYNNRIESTQRYGIAIGGSSTLATIQNNTVQNSTSYGIYNSDGNSTIIQNLIQNNTSGGIWVKNGSPTITVNQIENNGSHGIYINGGTPNINNNYSIKGHTYGIRVSGGTPNIHDNLNKQDEPSVAVINNNTHGIYITTGTPTINNNRIEYNTSHGVYQTNGTSIITNNTIKNNSSNGIYITDGISNTNNNNINNNGNYGINVSLGTSDLDNNIIQNNNYGIYINNGDTTITNNQITNNTTYGIRSNYLDPYLSGANNTITGNGTNEYFSHNFNILATSGTIRDTNLDIVIDRSSTLAAGKTLTMVPGNTVKFYNNLTTTILGTLISEGTSGNKITYTSINDGSGTPTYGNWSMIKVDTLTSNNTSFKYSIFKYSDKALYLSNTEASIDNCTFETNNTGIYVIGTSTTSTISNSILTSNKDYGIYVNSGYPSIDNNIITGGTYGIRVISNDTTITNNTIKETISRGIYYDNSSGLIDNNQIINNTGDGIEINNGTPVISNNTITGNTLYGLKSTYLDPYHVSYNNTIHTNGKDAYYSHYFDLSELTSGEFDFSEHELIIDRNSILSAGEEISFVPGSIIKSYNVSLQIDGKLTADGETGSGRIVFTSVNDNSVGNPLGSGSPAKGNWKYLYFNGETSSGSLLDNVDFRYAGGSSSKGIWIKDTQVDIKNSTLEQNYGYGLYYDGTGYGLLDNSIIQNNSSYGIYIIGGSIIITNNIVQNNGGGINSRNGQQTYNNNSILNNNSHGIYLYGTNTSSLDNNIFQNNNGDGIYVYNGNVNITNNQILGSASEGIYINNGNHNIDSNEISGSSSHGVYSNTGESVFTNNIVQNNTLNGLYINSGDLEISGNQFLNNLQYGIRSYNLQLRVGEDDVHLKNIATGNTLGKYASNGVNLYTSSGTVDGSLSDVIIIGNTALESGKQLTLVPGTIFKAGPSVQLNFQGKLTAPGETGTGRIIFTSINDNSVGESLGTGTPAKGNWAYMYLNGAGVNGSLIHNVEQRYANNHGILVNNGQVDIINSTIEENLGNGIYYNGTGYGLLENNIVQNNNGNGLYFYNGGSTVSNSLIQNNGLDGLYSRAGSQIITNSSFLNNTSEGVYLYGTSNSTLSGSIIENNGGQGLYIYNGSNIITNNHISGSVHNGIYINNGTSTLTNNQISGNTKNGIYINIGNHNLDTNEVTNNIQSGININNGASVLTNNTMTGNTEYGLISTYLDPFYANNNNTINSNGINAYYSHYFDLGTITDGIFDFSEHDLVVDRTSVLTSGEEVIIGSGSIIKVGNDVQLGIQGKLLVNGETGSGRVVFTSINDNSIGEELGSGNPVAGNWRHLQFYGAGADGSLLNNLDFRYSGGYYSKGIQAYNSQVDIKNSTIELNTGYGIFYEGTSTGLIDNNIIQNNTGRGAYFNSGDSIISNNIIQNNNSDGLYLYNGEQLINNNQILNNNGYGIYLYNGEQAIINNEISGSTKDGIYINVGDPIISGNEFNDNQLYGINSYNLQIRVGEADVCITNTDSGNLKGAYSSRGMDMIDLQGTIDGSICDVIITGNGILTSGKELIFTPGTIVKALSGIQLNVQGKLTANGGTGTGKIIFTSINDNSVGQELGTGEPVKGSWAYLYLNGIGTNGSLLDNIEQRYAGNYGIIVNNGHVDITDSTIEENSGHGIYFNGSATGFLDNNIIQNNNSNGIYLYNGGSTITNNLIQNNNSRGIYSREGNQIIINTSILNNNNDGIYLYGTSNSILTGNTIDNNNGYGLYVYNGTSSITNNQISGNVKDGVYLNAGTYTITNNTLENNTLNGIYINAGTTNISGNEFIENGEYGINSYDLQIRVGETDVGKTNTASGNILGHYVSRGINIQDTQGTIDGNEYDVIIIGNTALSSGKELIFTSGTIVKVKDNIQLYSYGKITAEGEETSKIVFTSINDNSVGEELGDGEPEAGSWNYLILNGPGADNSILDNIELRYAGASQSKGLRINNAIVTLTNSKIEENKGHGIYLYGSDISNINNNIIRNNTADGVYIYSGNHNIDGNEIYNNNRGIYVNSGTPVITNNFIKTNTSYGLVAHNLDPFLGSYGNTIIENGNNTYYAHYFTISGDYATLNFNVYIDQSSTLEAGKKLKLYPGTVIKIYDGKSLTIKGELESIGLPTDNIIFTSYRDNNVGTVLNSYTPSRGQWRGIQFSNATSNESVMKYTQIKYAQNGLYLSNSDVELQNNLVTETSSYGIYTTGGNPTISNTVLYNNSSNGLRCGTGIPNIKYNLFYNNGTDINSCTSGSGNLTGQAPLFIDTIEYQPTDLSPLVGVGDPDLGNHPASNSRYDIGVREGGVTPTFKYLKAIITKIGVGDTTIYWEFEDDPSNGYDLPVINNQGEEQVNFRVKYLGKYIVKATVSQGDNILDMGTIEFYVR